MVVNNNVCPRCGGNNVRIDIVQCGGKVKKKGCGFGGHLNNAARAITALFTLGISNIFWKKSMGTENQMYTSNRMAICQNCGYTWTIK